ncbi:hypothetical protein DOTSEDRAFT_25854 [Dothistroma septosporum NZE10]|uniref:DUF7730 domain-containing protein n=1 Tax=Dothistroma septosporum (strain NZE10 / CBS 128990) TaxID=675120 RepID=N1PL04_DOTSN|nr:hypothetical protein DOTSEDRAFT_25854 [Dothistroma septosporum NZE10]
MAETADEEATVTFEDLPAEIRVKIYGYVLTEPEGIALCAFNPKVDERKAAPRRVTGPRLIRDNNVDKYHRGETYDRKKKVWVLSTPLRTAILYVNKQIYFEATQVLLGTNHFSFRNTNALDNCLDLLGSRAQHLRFVYIGGHGYMKKHVKKTFTKLGTSARFLKKLYIDHFDMCKSSHRSDNREDWMIKRVANECKRMLKLLGKSYQKGGVVFNALDIVDFYLQPCTERHRHQQATPSPHDRKMNVAMVYGRASCKCRCAQAEQKHERMRQELRRRLAKALGIDEVKDES